MSYWFKTILSVLATGFIAACGGSDDPPYAALGSTDGWTGIVSLTATDVGGSNAFRHDNNKVPLPPL